MNWFNFGIAEMPGHLALVDQKMQELAAKNMPGLQRMFATGGKKLRPSLVIAIAHYSGKKVDDDVLKLAVAVELVHVASLVHDDVIDDGTLRWGQPTIFANEGVEAAVLAGDYLLAKACAVAASVSAQAAAILAETIVDLCLGEARELHDRNNIARTPESLLLATKGKTSSLFMTACRLGGLVAGLAPTQLTALSDVAENFGVAYQYMDDVHDIVASPASTGKSVGNDIKEGNYTLSVILSLVGPKGPALTKLLKAGADIKQIVGILQEDGSITAALKESENYKQAALHTLQQLKNNELAKVLKDFLVHCLPALPW